MFNVYYENIRTRLIQAHFNGNTYIKRNLSSQTIFFKKTAQVFLLNYFSTQIAFWTL